MNWYKIAQSIYQGDPSPHPNRNRRFSYGRYFKIRSETT